MQQDDILLIYKNKNIEGGVSMGEEIQKDFLRKRMTELREKNHKSQSDMADLIVVE